MLFLFFRLSINVFENKEGPRINYKGNYPQHSHYKDKQKNGYLNCPDVLAIEFTEMIGLMT